MEVWTYVIVSAAVVFAVVFVFAFPAWLLFTRTPQLKKPKKRKLAHFAEDHIQKGLTKPEELASKWLEEHPLEVMSGSFDIAFARRRDNFRAILKKVCSSRTLTQH